MSALADPVAYRAAPVAGELAAIAKAEKNWIYAGYRMTIYINSGEKTAEEQILKGLLPFYVADALQQAGGKVEKSDKDFAPLVVRGRELIIAQNPKSDHVLVITSNSVCCF